MVERIWFVEFSDRKVDPWDVRRYTISYDYDYYNSYVHRTRLSVANCQLRGTISGSPLHRRQS